MSFSTADLPSGGSSSFEDADSLSGIKQRFWTALPQYGLSFSLETDDRIPLSLVDFDGSTSPIINTARNVDTEVNHGHNAVHMLYLGTLPSRTPDAVRDRLWATAIPPKHDVTECRIHFYSCYGHCREDVNDDILEKVKRSRFVADTLSKIRKLEGCSLRHSLAILLRFCFGRFVHRFGAYPNFSQTSWPEIAKIMLPQKPFSVQVIEFQPSVSLRPPTPCGRHAWHRPLGGRIGWGLTPMPQESLSQADSVIRPRYSLRSQRSVQCKEIHVLDHMWSFAMGDKLEDATLERIVKLVQRWSGVAIPSWLLIQACDYVKEHNDRRDDKEFKHFWDYIQIDPVSDRPGIKELGKFVCSRDYDEFSAADGAVPDYPPPYTSSSQDFSDFKSAAMRLAVQNNREIQAARDAHQEWHAGTRGLEDLDYLMDFLKEWYDLGLRFEPDKSKCQPKSKAEVWAYATRKLMKDKELAYATEIMVDALLKLENQ